MRRFGRLNQIRLQPHGDHAALLEQLRQISNSIAPLPSIPELLFPLCKPTPAECTIIEKDSPDQGWFADLPRHLVLEILCCTDFLTRLKLNRVCQLWMRFLMMPGVIESLHTDIPSLQYLIHKLARAQYRVCSQFSQLTVCMTAGQQLAHLSPLQCSMLLQKCPKLQTLIIQPFPLTFMDRWLLPADSKQKLTVAAASRAFRLNIVGGKYINVTWTAELERTEFGGLEEIADGLNRLWWPYSSAQKTWLKLYARMLKNDHFWMDWVFTNFAGMTGFRDLLSDESTYENLDILTGPQAGRVLCAMAAFVLRRGVPNLKRPPYRFAFETDDFSRFTYRSTPLRQLT